MTLHGQTKPIFYCPECESLVLTRANATEEEQEARIEFHEYIAHGIGDTRLPVVTSIRDLEAL